MEGKAPDFDAGFDDNGNLRSLAPGQPMVWTARNQLDAVTLLARSAGDNDSERYVYDAPGMRLRKVRRAHAASVIRTAEVRYLPGLEIRTEGVSGTAVILQVISLQAGRSSVRLLHWERGQPDEIEEDQLRFSLDDHLGSSTLELDRQGKVISYEGYYPYGGTAWWMGRSQVEASYKFVRYSGKERDATGLYYYGFRYYAPWVQRWINPDPAGIADGLNLFCMVKNNPIALSDTLGLYSGRDDDIEKQTLENFEIAVRGRVDAEVEHLEALDQAFELALDILESASRSLEHGGEADDSLENASKGVSGFSSLCYQTT
ncbi:RHS repeat-associated core domain-containing protein [Pseudomonas sp. Ant30-3]|uniref:RHS repeat-associated core domain-containing protein n=1 Tax=Pseudomonas sp. Ant30-3 TaxID=1488328 RepID=UPI00067C9F5F|nr:RHS repeat-associated core domain-containing protein [Pseudomonas sp. Ant30-3]